MRSNAKRTVNEIQYVTFWIPGDLAKDIDKVIEKTEGYANRPDFILSALRWWMPEFDCYLITYQSYYDGYVPKGMAAIIEPPEFEKAKNEEKLCTSVMLHWAIANYHAYSEKLVRMAVRVPKGIKNQWERIRTIENFPIVNFTDFIRYAIASYVSNVDYDLERSRAFEDNLKGQETIYAELGIDIDGFNNRLEIHEVRLFEEALRRNRKN